MKKRIDLMPSPEHSRQGTVWSKEWQQVCPPTNDVESTATRGNPGCTELCLTIPAGERPKFREIDWMARSQGGATPQPARLALRSERQNAAMTAPVNFISVL